MAIKDESYYANLEAKYGLHARRAAEAADKLAAEVESGELDFGAALSQAFGSAYRPGQISGR